VPGGSKSRMIEAVNLTFSWNAYTDIAQHGTTLTDPSTMNETDFTIVQGMGTVQEWATRCRIRPAGGSV